MNVSLMSIGADTYKKGSVFVGGLPMLQNNGLKSTQEKSRALKIWDRVIFTGARTDVNKLYSVMDVFCLPSFYEGMPVVAMAGQSVV